MAAYAVGLLDAVEMGPGITAYLQAIDQTLAPFGGRFLIHGGTASRLEGGFAGDLIVIAFPDRDAALGWYRSPAYQAILPLRTRHARGSVFVIDGVAPGHPATDILAG